jgi:predicted RNA binding protein YcfA (HicA-like mRNA interferase family)
VGLARTKQQQRCYERVAENRKNCSFADLKQLLEAFGFVERPRTSGSSHVIFKHPTMRNSISVPFSRPVKEHYVRQVLKAIAEVEGGEAT